MASSTEAKGVLKSGLLAFQASSYAICAAARALAAAAASVAARDDDAPLPIPCIGENAGPPPKPCGDGARGGSLCCGCGCCMADLRRLVLSRKILVYAVAKRERRGSMASSLVRLRQPFPRLPIFSVLYFWHVRAKYFLGNLKFYHSTGW